MQHNAVMIFNKSLLIWPPHLGIITFRKVPLGIISAATTGFKRNAFRSGNSEGISLPEIEQTVILMVRPSWFYAFIFGMAGLVNFMLQHPCFHTL
jgi:hypothetical protein